MPELCPAASLTSCATALLLAVVAPGSWSCRTDDRKSPARANTAAAGLTASDSLAIAAADSTFLAAVNAGDVEALASVYATDAQLLPPNLPLQRGRAAIRRFWGGLLEGYSMRLETTLDMLEGREDLAYHLGHYRFTAVPKAKAAPGIADEGKFVEILKKQPDGSWKYFIDIYNSNLAPQR